MDRFSPVIIEPPIFQAVQEAMDSNPRRGKHWDYVFTNFFFCGTCNSTVSGATQTEGQHRNGTYPYYRCRGTLPDVSSAKMRPKICSMESVRADKLEPVVREHIFGAVKDPTLILEGMQQTSLESGGKLQKRISGLERRWKKSRLEVATLTKQLMGKRIDQEMYEILLAPVNHLLAQLEKDIAILKEQEKVEEERDQFGERVRAALSKYSDSLDELDDEGMQRLMRLLNTRLIREPDGVLVTGVLDPSLFTIGRTSASQRGHSRLSQ